MKAFSLLYHDVVAAGDFEHSGFAGPEAAVYKLTDHQFAAHLDAISRQISAKPSILSGQTLDPGPTTTWMLHFDDGGVSAIETVAPLLQELGWSAHFHITTDFIGKPEFVRKEDIRALRQQGHVIGTHSSSHPVRISRLDSAALVREWRESRDILSDILGEEVVIGSVPGGFYSRRVAEAASEAGLRVLFNSEPVADMKHVRACRVLGRYSIDARVPPTTAAAIASGRFAPRLNQFLYWNCKKAAKATMGRLYASVRSHLLRQRTPTAG